MTKAIYTTENGTSLTINHRGYVHTTDRFGTTTCHGNRDGERFPRHAPGHILHNEEVVSQGIGRDAYLAARTYEETSAQYDGDPRKTDILLGWQIEEALEA